MPMKRLWSTDELAERWMLAADDLRLTIDHGEQAKLGLMCQLAFWREHARFPEVEADIAPAVVEHLARQIGVSTEVLEGLRRPLRASAPPHGARPFGGARVWRRGRSRLPRLAADCLPAEPAPLALEEA